MPPSEVLDRKPEFIVIVNRSPWEQGTSPGLVIDPAKTLMPSSLGEFYWGGAYSTAFFVDPVEGITCVFMTQVYPSSTYPIRRQLKTLIYSALSESRAD